MVCGNSLDLFVASTPFQLINCTEARAYYKSTNCRLILVRPDNEATVSQLSFLITRLGWKADEVTWLTKKSFYLKLPFVFRRIKKAKIARLFIGNRGSWLHEIFFTGLACQDVVFVDDGLTSTFRYYINAQTQPSQSQISKGKRKLLRGLGISLCNRHDEKLVFFTCFPLTSHEFVEVITHEFSVFRSCFFVKKRNRGNDNDVQLVGYLGQKAGDAQMRKQLVKHLQSLEERHPRPEQIVYFMHRKEKGAQLLPILNEMDVEARMNRLPIEIEVAMSAEAYRAFYGFSSTALFTLKLMFPELEVYQIEDPAMGEAFNYPKEMDAIFRIAGVKTAEL